MTETSAKTMKLVPRKQSRLCDYCNDTTVLLYCRADSAKLCLSCDLEVHSTNQLFSQHTRSKLCDSCDNSPASTFCETERSVLCQNCDWENHSLCFSSVHNRRPIEGFSGCPSVSELVTSLGFEDVGCQKTLFFSEDSNGFSKPELDGSGFGDGLSDLLVWNIPAFGSIDDLIVSCDSGHNFQALGVPPLPKNRNAACGQHKDEMIRQLRDLAKLEPSSDYGIAEIESFSALQSLPPGDCPRQPKLFAGCENDAQPMSFPGYEEDVLHCSNDADEAANQVFEPSTLSGKDLEENYVVPWSNNTTSGETQVNDDHESQRQPSVPAGTLPLFPKVVPHEINSQKRDSAISRYKEKKKARRYEKHIRYESRKVGAEGRTRIKGRFAKVDQ